MAADTCGGAHQLYRSRLPVSNAVQRQLQHTIDLYNMLHVSSNQSDNGFWVKQSV
jgi:hypothetical protein